MKRVEIFSGNWTEIDVMKSPNKWFVFGDNCERWGKGGQAIIRDLKNTIGIRTKKKPDNYSTSFFNDAEYESNCQIILEDIINIKQKLILDSEVVLSKNGYGTGLAKMSERSPKTFDYLNECLRSFLHFDNILGTRFNKLPSGNEIASGDYVNLKDIVYPESNSLLLESSLISDCYNSYDQILNQKKLSITSDNFYEKDKVLNFYYPGKKLYLVCKVLHDSVKVENVENGILSNFEGYRREFIDDYNPNKFVTFIEFVCTLEDNGNIVYNSDYFHNDVPIVNVESEQKKEDVLSLEQRVDDLAKKVDLILDFLTKKL